MIFPKMMTVFVIDSLTSLMPRHVCSPRIDLQGAERDLILASTVWTSLLQIHTLEAVMLDVSHNFPRLEGSNMLEHPQTW